LVKFLIFSSKPLSHKGGARKMIEKKEKLPKVGWEPTGVSSSPAKEVEEYKTISFINETSNLWRLGQALEKLGIKYKIIEYEDGYKYTFYIPKECKILEDRYITDRYFGARAVTILVPGKAKVYFFNHESFTNGSQLIISIREIKKR